MALLLGAGGWLGGGEGGFGGEGGAHGGGWGWWGELALEGFRWGVLVLGLEGGFRDLRARTRACWGWGWRHLLLLDVSILLVVVVRVYLLNRLPRRLWLLHHLPDLLLLALSIIEPRRLL